MVATKSKSYWGNTWFDLQALGLPAAMFVVTQLIGGLPILPYIFFRWHSDDLFRFGCFLAVALVASVLKVHLPGIKATMSANFLFILVGILDLTYSETLLMGCLGGLVQTLWRAKPRPRPIQWLFNLATSLYPLAPQNWSFIAKLQRVSDFAGHS